MKALGPSLTSALRLRNSGSKEVFLASKDKDRLSPYGGEVRQEINVTGSILAEYATEDEAAIELDVSRRTLARWRARRVGPPYTSIGRKLRYRRSSIAAWLQKQERDPAVVKVGRRRA
jgi:hypothetical protein